MSEGGEKPKKIPFGLNSTFLMWQEKPKAAVLDLSQDTAFTLNHIESDKIRFLLFAFFCWQISGHPPVPWDAVTVSSLTWTFHSAFSAFYPITLSFSRHHTTALLMLTFCVPSRSTICLFRALCSQLIQIVSIYPSVHPSAISRIRSSRAQSY